jgi:hypothetical protein
VQQNAAVAIPSQRTEVGKLRCLIGPVYFSVLKWRWIAK